jgi:hypothetical protein
VLQYFDAARSDQDVLLSWGVAPTNDIKSFVIQRSTNGTLFDSLAMIAASTATYQYTDAAANIEGTLDYRLAWEDANGQWSYSRIVAVAGMPGPDARSVTIYPNPAMDHLTVSFVSTTAGSASLTISNALGQSMLTRPLILQHGLNTVSIPLGTLAPATYFLVLQSGGRRMVKAFLKNSPSQLH